MIPLFEDCRRTVIKVFPTNWQTAKASTKKDWYIWYRYFDPANLMKYPKGKLVIIKGMNYLKDSALRRACVERQIAEEEALLDVQGYNPITETYFLPPVPVLEPSTEEMVITPGTGLLPSLEWAFENVGKAPSTMRDLKSTMKYFRVAATELKLNDLPISEVKRRDIKLILEKIGKIKESTVITYKNGNKKQCVWTASNYNFFKGHLEILFFFLEEWDVFDQNPMARIKKKTSTPKPRLTLQADKYNKVESELHENDYYFWRFVKIFEQSGARRSELLGVLDIHVDISNKTFKILVNKGEQPEWHDKDIDPIVLDLWSEVMAEARELRKLKPAYGTRPIFLFSVKQRVAFRVSPIRAEQVTRKWNRLVKKKMGVKEDLYSLKHRRTTSDVDKFIDKTIKDAQQAAATKNGHTTDAMVKGVYDVKSKVRREELKKELKR